jgi:hypothetical protein
MATLQKYLRLRLYSQRQTNLSEKKQNGTIENKRLEEKLFYYYKCI